MWHISGFNLNERPLNEGQAMNIQSTHLQAQTQKKSEKMLAMWHSAFGFLPNWHTEQTNKRRRNKIRFHKKNGQQFILIPVLTWFYLEMLLGGPFNTDFLHVPHSELMQLTLRVKLAQTFSWKDP
jgi:hypothetical protein